MTWHGVTINDGIGGRDNRSATYATTTALDVPDPLALSDSISLQRDVALTITDRISAIDAHTDAQGKRYPFRDKGGHSPLRPVVIPRRRFFGSR